LAVKLIAPAGVVIFGALIEMEPPVPTVGNDATLIAVAGRASVPADATLNIDSVPGLRPAGNVRVPVPAELTIIPRGVPKLEALSPVKVRFPGEDIARLSPVVVKEPLFTKFTALVVRTRGPFLTVTALAPLNVTPEVLTIVTLPAMIGLTTPFAAATPTVNG